MIHLAVDLGTKRIGLAISDEGGGFAFPLQVIHVRGVKKDIPAICEAARSAGAETVVLGLPLNIDGTEGDMARKARKFAGLLQQAGLPVVLHDERLSSYTAESLLQDQRMAGGRRGKPHGRTQPFTIDAQAAAVFLQCYLDAKKEAVKPVQ